MSECEFCGGWFEKTDTNQRFCTFLCKRSGYHERRYGREAADRWRAHKDMERSSGDMAGLVAELDGIGRLAPSLPTEEEIAELIPTIKASTRISDWPKDEQDAHRGTRWDSVEARERWMAQYRRMKVAASIVKLYEDRAKGRN